ncbi:hypothetical protein ACLOJK_033845 [Asimina triloba]
MELHESTMVVLMEMTLVACFFLLLWRGSKLTAEYKITGTFLLSSLVMVAVIELVQKQALVHVLLSWALDYKSHESTMVVLMEMTLVACFFLLLWHGSKSTAEYKITGTFLLSSLVMVAVIELVPGPEADTRSCPPVMGVGLQIVPVHATSTLKMITFSFYGFLFGSKSASPALHTHPSLFQPCFRAQHRRPDVKQISHLVFPSILLKMANYGTVGRPSSLANSLSSVQVRPLPASTSWVPPSEFELQLFSIPSTPEALVKCVIRNLAYFQFHNIFFVWLILFVSLVPRRHISLIFLVGTTAVACLYLLLLRAVPDSMVLHRIIDRRLVLAFLGIVAAVEFILTHAVIHLLVSLATGIPIILFHVVFRSQDDLFVSERASAAGELVPLVDKKESKTESPV